MYLTKDTWENDITYICLQLLTFSNEYYYNKNINNNSILNLNFTF